MLPFRAPPPLPGLLRGALSGDKTQLYNRAITYLKSTAVTCVGKNILFCGAFARLALHREQLRDPMQSTAACSSVNNNNCCKVTFNPFTGTIISSNGFNKQQPGPLLKLPPNY